MGSAPPPPHRRRDGFDVYNRSGGIDYWPVLEDFLAGRLEAENLKHNRGKRRVYAVERGGRKYVLKRDLMRSMGLRRIFPLGGWTFHTRVMRKVNLAVDRGCRAAPDIYLVAERWAGIIRQEVFVLMEFVDGSPLIHVDSVPYRDAIRATILDMQAHDLTLSDVNSRNIMVGPDGIKVIDLSCRFPDFLSKIRDSMKIKARYGVDVPVSGVVNNIFRAALAVFYRLRGRIN